MKTKELVNKDGTKLETKDGIILKDHFLEMGDELIPKHNYIIEKRKTANIKGEDKIITEYKIISAVRTNGEENINDNGYNEFFISLTPTQAKSFKSKIESGIEINQNVFVTYEYVNDYGKQIGVGMKRDEKPAISF